MRNCRFLLLLLWVFVNKSAGHELPELVIYTSLGDIWIQVDTVHAPVTALNFLALSEKGAYQNSAFYRVVRPDNQPGNKVKIEVIQGGLLFQDDRIEQYAPVIHESTHVTGLKHTGGTLSMARIEPGSASTEFFICIGDQPELDYGGKRNPDGQGFAAFGKVTRGMETVKLIQQQSDKDKYLWNPVQIKDIVLVKEKRRPDE